MLGKFYYISYYYLFSLLAYCPVSTEIVSSRFLAPLNFELSPYDRAVYLAYPFQPLSHNCTFFSSTSYLWPLPCDLPKVCGDTSLSIVLTHSWFSETELCTRFHHPTGYFYMYSFAQPLFSTISMPGYPAVKLEMWVWPRIFTFNGTSYLGSDRTLDHGLVTNGSLHVSDLTYHTPFNLASQCHYVNTTPHLVPVNLSTLDFRSYVLTDFPVFVVNTDTLISDDDILFMNWLSDFSLFITYSGNLVLGRLTISQPVDFNISFYFNSFIAYGEVYFISYPYNITFSGGTGTYSINGALANFFGRPKIFPNASEVCVRSIERRDTRNYFYMLIDYLIDHIRSFFHEALDTLVGLLIDLMKFVVDSIFKVGRRYRVVECIILFLLAYYHTYNFILSSITAVIVAMIFLDK